ncbi:MAG: response regulator [Sphingobacteriaceae bacterium]|nr:response regulator [Cytophagaceae bacterium]
MKLNSRIALLLGCGLLITVLIGANAYRITRRLVTTNEQVVQTHLVLQQTQRIQAQLTNLDNNVRAYLLSDNPYFKGDFERTALGMGRQLRTLQSLTVDNQSQQERLRTVDRLFHAKVRLSAPLLADKLLDNRMARLDSVKRFLELSERARFFLVGMEAEERTRLNERVAQSQRSATVALIGSLMGAALALGLIVWAITLLYNTLGNRTRLNRQLQENEQRLKQILEAIPVSVSVVDPQGKLFFSNQAAVALFGEQLLTDSYSDLLSSIKTYRFPSGEPYPPKERPLLRAMRGETSQVDDMEIRTAGRSFLVLSSARPVFDSDGTLRYVVSSSIDITETNLSRQRMQEAKELAERAALVKENFLANMSHEIRTPLNAILGFSNLLENTPLSAEQQEFVHSLRTAGKNLLTIVNDILDLSKIEAGMLQLESIPFSIASLADSIRIMLLPAALDKDLRLRIETDPILPPVVLGDPTRLTQILLNLTGNAIKFTEKGLVQMHIETMDISDTTVRVRFTVKDTGIGIAPEELPHIFERFRQESNFTTRHYGGSGLGLSIVKSLVDIQKGRLRVHSTPGQGSLFEVDLTYAIAHDTYKETLLPGPNQGLAENQSVTVLVVEDNPMNQKLAVAVLNRLGYESVVAENGEKALELLARCPFDIVLMDIQMPVMDGYETTRHIRNRLRSEVPIIAMTAHALAGEREECFRVGMNGFIPKPFQMEELQQTIRTHLPTVPTVLPRLEPDEILTPAPGVFRLDYLREITANDPVALAELLDAYLSYTPGQLQELRQAMDSGELTALKRAVHSLKAPAQMLGMDEAARLLIETETRLAADDDLTAIRPLLDAALALLDGTLPAIREAAQPAIVQP